MFNCCHFKLEKAVYVFKALAMFEHWTSPDLCGKALAMRFNLVNSSGRCVASYAADPLA